MKKVLLLTVFTAAVYAAGVYSGWWAAAEEFQAGSVPPEVT